MFVAVAALFAVITGANDGGAILATGLKLPILRVWAGLTLLTLAVAVVPLLIGTGVAATFTERLVTFDEPLPVLIGVVAALTVVIGLTTMGRPTSLTLATVGGLAGAGLGAGLPVSYGWVAFVLLLGMAAPLAGWAAAVPVSRLLARVPAGGMLGRLHLGGFTVQCGAYAANDGQKMLAVFAVAFGTTGGRPPGWTIPLIAVLFFLGACYGLPRAARTLGGQLLAVRPVHAVAAETAAAGAVLGCSAMGAPVSMTQAVAGGLIGSGVTQAVGRVRWAAVLRLVVAWVLTLPTSVLLAAIGAMVLA